MHDSEAGARRDYGTEAEASALLRTATVRNRRRTALDGTSRRRELGRNPRRTRRQIFFLEAFAGDEGGLRTAFFDRLRAAAS